MTTSESQPADAVQAPPEAQAAATAAPPPPPLSPPPPDGAVPLTDDGGVYKLTLTAAAGVETSTEVPNPGDQVTVHWVGRYHGGQRDGEQFWSTRDPDGRGRPVSFRLDDGQSLRAMERCLPTMRRGELCRLFARCDYAYGEADDTDADAATAAAAAATAAAAPRGPPGASVTFDLELVDWRGEDISAEKDGSLLRSRVRHGEGFVSPTLASRVTVQLRGRLADAAPATADFLPPRRLEFELGEALPAADAFCPGLEAALYRMFKGELARLWLAPRLGFGCAGCAELAVPPDSRLLYELELLDFVKPREVWQLSRREKLQEAEAARLRGIECIAAGNLRLAHVHCKRVVDYLEWDADFHDDAELLADRLRLLTSGRLNLALVCLKLEKYQQAAVQCTSVLEKLDSQSEKALYRRGQARLHTCDFDKALDDFRACLAVNPANSAARAGAAKCLAGERSVAERERQTFAGMFDRFAKQDRAKGKLGGDYAAADFPIDTWDNRLADGMLSIPQELEAFGEEMPQKVKRGGAGGGGGGATIVEVEDEK